MPATRTSGQASPLLSVELLGTAWQCARQLASALRRLKTLEQEQLEDQALRDHVHAVERASSLPVFVPTAELYGVLHLNGDRIARDTSLGDAWVVDCMAALGFERYRETTGQRRRGYRRSLVDVR